MSIKEIQKTILELSKDPKEADTVKALRKQIESMRPCAHGEYTGIPFKGCRTCDNTVRVKCKKKNYGFVNSGKCNAQNCKHFERLTLKTKNLTLKKGVENG